eukprot:TRINITY_DN13567_c0_g1_i1.p1 TRINITY_DN13567_c0_g1~~TRINITY_DN13567_c0_g1_i1.p1  ORF type:complete len:127 (-),score=61.02 TRINITY_DN13567_c0_g1_i1:106-486(-)
MLRSLLFNNVTRNSALFANTLPSYSYGTTNVCLNINKEDYFGKKGRSLEEADARRRDQEAIAALRQQLNKKKAEVVEEHGVDLDDEEEGINLDEFLSFRKEMIDKVRELEDEVISLKYKVNQIRRR